jgi:DNA-binding response OmpR family regulator
MNYILVIDTPPSVYRIKEIASKSNISVYDANNSSSALNVLNTYGTSISLIIIDVSIDGEDGFSLIEKLKTRHPDIPIVVLTSFNKRTHFIRGIKLGIADYILKPFDDSVIKNRVFSHIKSDAPGLLTHVSNAIELRKYLASEILKARKWKYSVTVSLIAFYNRDEDFEVSGDSPYNQLTEVFHSKMLDIYFETDICIPFGPQLLISISPFCTPENVHFIDSKVVLKGEQILQELSLRNFKVATSYVTVPHEESTVDSILDSLYNEIEMSIRTSTTYLERMNPISDHNPPSSYDAHDETEYRRKLLATADQHPNTESYAVEHTLSEDEEREFLNALISNDDNAIDEETLKKFFSN